MAFWGGMGKGLRMLRVNGELVDQELVEETFHRVKTRCGLPNF